MPFTAPLPCPSYFDEHAKVEWARVCQVLVDRGTLQDINHATLEGYCAAYSRAVRAEIELADGLTTDELYFDKKGNPTGSKTVKKPEVAIAERAWGQVKTFAVELGITTSVPELENENLTETEKALQEADRIFKKNV